VVLAVERDDTPGSPSGPRLGITASRRVGGAVQRNLVKRRIREWFRETKTALPARLDLVVIARRGAVSQGADASAAELSRLVREVAS
jgi:ribonuclease P protein component